VTILAASAREEIADFVGAFVTVYVIVIIAWVVLSFIFSMGVRVPYSRWSNAVMDFLRDVSTPWLNLFRRLPLRIGPLDLTPIVAIIVLQILGGIVVRLIDPA
jgi:YggT family protein